MLGEAVMLALGDSHRPARCAQARRSAHRRQRSRTARRSSTCSPRTRPSRAHLSSRSTEAIARSGELRRPGAGVRRCRAGTSRSANSQTNPGAVTNMPLAAVNGTRDSLSHRCRPRATTRRGSCCRIRSAADMSRCGRRKSRRFAKHYRVLRYDTRGHGHSDAPKGPYTIDQLIGDVIGLMDHPEDRARELLRPVDGRADRRRSRRASSGALRARRAVEHGGADRLGRRVDAARREGARAGRHARADRRGDRRAGSRPVHRTRAAGAGE